MKAIIVSTIITVSAAAGLSEDYLDIDLFGPYGRGLRLNGDRSTLTGTWNLSASDGTAVVGYESSETLKSATGWLLFRSTNLVDQYLWPFELNPPDALNGTNELTLDIPYGQITVKLAGHLTDTGTVDYTVRRLTGDFYVHAGYLDAQTCERRARASVRLWVLPALVCLLGAAGLRERFQRRPR